MKISFYKYIILNDFFSSVNNEILIEFLHINKQNFFN